MRMTTVLFVHRDFVGRDIPFDKLYFFHKDDEKDIPRVFPNSYVLPINQQLANAISHILESSKTRANQTNEYALKYRGRGFDRLDKRRQTLMDAQAAEAIEHIIKNRSKYVALVPVLFTKQHPPVKRARKKGDQKYRDGAIRQNTELVYPQYLTALQRRRKDSITELSRKMLGTRAYFIYRGEIFRPLCILCPHSIDSVVGDCVFGSMDCYFNLGNIGESDFTRGVKAYRELVKRIDEPELNTQGVF